MTERSSADPPDSPQAFAQYYGLTSSFLDLDETLIPHLTQADSLNDLYDCFQDEHYRDLAGKSGLWAVGDTTQRFLVEVLDEKISHGSFSPQVSHIRHLKVELPVLHGDHESQLRVLLEKSQGVTRASQAIADLPKYGSAPASLAETIRDAVPLIQCRLQLQQESLHVLPCTLEYVGILVATPCDDLRSDEVTTRLAPNAMTKEEIPIFPLLDPVDLSNAQSLDPPSDRLIPSPHLEHDIWTREFEMEVSAMLDESFDGLDSPSRHGSVDAGSTIDQMAHRLTSIEDANQITSVKVMSPILPLLDHDVLLTSKTIDHVTTLAPHARDDLHSMNDDEITDIIRQIAGPEHVKVNRMLAAERLIEINTTLKLRLPQLLLYEPAIPWHVNRAGDQTPLRHVPNGHETRWPGITKIERRLQWTPFEASLAAMSAETRLPCEQTTAFDSCCYGFLHELIRPTKMSCGIEQFAPMIDQHIAPLVPGALSGRESVPPSPESLAQPSMVARASDTTTIYPADDNRNQSDLSTLLRKRKDALRVVAKPVRGIQVSMSAGTMHMPMPAYRGSLAMGVTGFMKTHGRPITVEQSPLSLHDNDLMLVENKTVQPATLQKEVPRLQHHTLYDGSIEHAARQVIVSLKMITERRLMKDLQQALPHTLFIERSEIPNNRHTEADITLSPTSGIYLTSLQKVRQRALPGQTRVSGVRADIEHICARYGRLFVLVSDQDSSSHALTTHDSEAISDLIGWTSLIRAVVDVIYIAGGESGLSGWIAGLVQRCKTVGFRLAEEESMWERFLRMAGLNAFSAQTVLAGLKSWCCTEAEDSQAATLARLLTLSRAERALFLSALSLGSAVLSKLDELAEASWSIEA